MTGAEAWRIISQEFDELFRYRAFSYKSANPPFMQDELSAQVTAFMALKQMDEEKKKEDTKE